VGCAQYRCFAEGRHIQAYQGPFTVHNTVFSLWQLTTGDALLDVTGGAIHNDLVQNFGVATSLCSVFTDSRSDEDQTTSIRPRPSATEFRVALS
jgi:hypothetical protein